jgi:hypothetical protein
MQSPRYGQLGQEELQRVTQSELDDATAIFLRGTYITKSRADLESVNCLRGRELRPYDLRRHTVNYAPAERLGLVLIESTKEPPCCRLRKPTPGEFAIIDGLTGDI